MRLALALLAYGLLAACAPFIGPSSVELAAMLHEQPGAILVGPCREVRSESDAVECFYQWRRGTASEGAVAVVVLRPTPTGWEIMQGPEFLPVPE